MQNYMSVTGPVDIEEAIQKLDTQLTYLWRIHAVDYYAGKENADPMYYALRSTSERLIRGTRPEEGEQAADAQGTAWILVERLDRFH